MVAYSLGGLVARVAYALLRAAGNASPWVRTVYVACPHGGTYSAAAALAGYQLPGGPADYLADAVGVIGRRISRPFASFNNLQTRLLQTLASWPALYELLPNVQAHYIANDPSAVSLFQQKFYAPFNPFVTQDRLDSTLQTQKLLETYLAGPRPDEVCVYGTGFPTFSAINFPSKLNDPSGYLQRENGDAQVIQERAILFDSKNAQIQANHASIAADGDLTSQIVSYVVNGIPSNETIQISDLAPFKLIQEPTPPLVLQLPQFPLKQVRGDP